MPENEFDKQVKKMMDELKLRPSEGVWPGVERRLREKKRRRRALIIFPLLAGMMLLGYSGIHYFLSKAENKKSGVNSRNETNKQTENKVSIPLNSTNTDKINQTGVKEGPDIKETTGIKNSIASKVKITKVTAFEKDPNSKLLITSNRKTPENNPPPVLKKEKKIGSIPVYEDKSEKPETPSGDASNQKNENKIVTNVDTNRVTNADINGVANVDTNNLNVKNDSNLLKIMTSIKSMNASAVSKRKQQERKLTWGFHLSTGVSGTSSKFFQLNQNKSLESRSSSNASTGGTSYSTPVPNSSKAGFAFKTGGLVEKRFSKRSSLDLGLQYSYYSDQIKVGNRRDSLLRIQTYYSADLFVPGFYQNTSTNNYINRYHFIELPLNLHFQLITGKLNSLNWDFGLSIGQLLSTNTLVFDTANRGIYYTDKKLFRKTHANLSTGFSITFNKYKSMQWVIGPQLQLGLSNLYKSYTDKRAYLFFAGIDIRLMLPKK